MNMRRPGRRTLSAMPLRFLTAAVAAVAFLPALPADARTAQTTQAAAAAQGTQTPEPPDRITAAWRTDPLYVDERLRAAIDRTELSRIRREMQSAAMPVYVAIVPETPYIDEVRSKLPTLLHARTGEPGLYLVAVARSSYWNTIEELYRPAGLAGRTLVSVRGEDPQRFDLDEERPAPTIVRTIQYASRAYEGRPLPAIDVADLEPRKRPGVVDEPSYTDQVDRAAYTGVGIGAVVGLVLTLWIALGRRRSQAKKRTAAEPKPADAVNVRRKAEAKINEAERALARLERRRTATAAQLDQRDEAVRRLDAAKALRAKSEDDVLAATGALVLAQQAGRILAGKAVQPPCFFNPLHLPGTVRVNWSDDVEVPACRQCAIIVRNDKVPDGLYVPKPSLLGKDRKAVPYWTLDPEDSPMVATGFGALSDDLADRIVARKEDEVR
jgi:hypothetical protein